MSMNIRNGFGIAALVLAIAAWFLTDMTGVWVSMVAMIAAAISAAMRGYLLAMIAIVIVLLKTFFFDPTLWTITAGTERPGRDRSVDAVRIILIMSIAAPIIATAARHIESGITDGIIAVFSILALIGFLSVIVMEVPQGPLIAVFAIAVAMGIYDFIRELRSRPNATKNPDPPDS